MNLHDLPKQLLYSWFGDMLFYLFDYDITPYYLTKGLIVI